MKIYCPKHSENHNIMPKDAERLIYYLRRLYIEASYARPLIVTPISAGVEYTYNKTCILSELDDLKNIDMEAMDQYSINAAHAEADYNTRRRLDEPSISKASAARRTRGYNKRAV